MDDAICYVQQGCQIHKSGGYLAVALQLRFDCRRVNPYQRILEYQFRLELDCHANHVPRLEIVDRAPPSFLPICAECSATTPIDNINKDTGPQA